MALDAEAPIDTEKTTATWPGSMTGRLCNSGGMGWGRGRGVVEGRACGVEG